MFMASRVWPPAPAIDVSHREDSGKDISSAAKTAKKVSLDAENGLTDAKHSSPTSILSEL